MSQPKTIRVLVCGGRSYNDPLCVGAWLGAIHKATPIGAIIHGGASGADHLAAKFAEWKGILCIEYLADWKAHGRAAGPIRNRAMLENGRPDLVVAFPGGRGTADMMRQARAAGVPVKDTSIEPLS